MAVGTPGAGLEQILPTERLASFSLETKLADIDDAARTRPHACAPTPSPASWPATKPTSASVSSRSRLNCWAARPDATLVVSGQKLPVATVAYLHAQLANALDAEETFFNRAHFAGVVVAPALALAEARGIGARETLAAIAIGYDVAARVNLSLRASMWDADKGVQFAGPWGHSYAVFGAAAALGRLQGLSTEQLMHAFGIAYMSAPLHTTWMVFPRNVPRTMTKYSMYGAIAEAGVTAVDLAGRGFTGNFRALDPDQEFWRGFSARSCDYGPMFDELGTHWYVTDVAYKPYPNGRHTNIALDLLTDIVSQEGLTAGDIDKVTITLPPGGVTDEVMRDFADRTQLDATFTLKYAASAVAHRLKPGPLWLRRVTYAGAETRAFEARINLVVNEDWRDVVTEQVRELGWVRRLPTRVEVEARGSVFRRDGDTPLGDPWDDDTYMTDDQLRDKFVEYTRYAVGEESARLAAKLAFESDRSTAGVGGLLTALSRRQDA